jgi:hypothetical protein
VASSNAWSATTRPRLGERTVTQPTGSSGERTTGLIPRTPASAETFFNTNGIVIFLDAEASARRPRQFFAKLV